jgi:hypothetical protein
MSRTSIAVLLSCLMAVGSLEAAARSAAAAAPGSIRAPRNTQSPLPPAGPATIKQAQAADWTGPLIGAAVTGGIFLAVLLLINDDADGPATTATTATLQ